MNRRSKKKKEVSDRKRIHEILDLVLDINGLQKSQVEVTGNHPTAFFEFNGHVGDIDVRLYLNGWGSGVDYNVDLTSTVYKDFRNNLPAVAEKLKELRDSYGTG